MAGFRHRFFVGPGAAARADAHPDGDRVTFDGALAHQMARVLRLRAGEPIVLFDGSGTEQEGGFTSAELNVVEHLGAGLVSLGPRILRAETAGPILALYESGDLEPPGSHERTDLLS